MQYPNLHNLALHYKLLFITIISVLGALFFAYIALISLEIYHSINQSKEQLRLSGKTVSSNIHSAVVFDDKQYASQAMDAFKFQKNVLSMMLAAKLIANSTMCKLLL